MKRVSCLAFGLAILFAGVCYGQPVAPAAAANEGGWVDISEKVLKGLEQEGKKIGYPGKTAGIAVDRTTGDVFMVVPDQGLWKSSDRGATFARVDGGKIGGRCETAFALNFDPNGKRLACFMLDGPSAYTLDGGKTWQGMKQMGRGWDSGCVDWSAAEPKHIFGLRHEWGYEVYTSDDMGKDWTSKGKPIVAGGIFDAKTLVAVRGPENKKEKGIFRSTDGGNTWEKVSDLQPGGRDIRIFKGVAYWAGAEGLLVSRDKGKTWAVQGSPVECSFGPFFGKDEKHIVVMGKKGFYETKDGGQTWHHVAPLPPDMQVHMPGWFVNVAWDPLGDVFYASNMGKPAYKYQR
jgi:photosystem II stability/assembly factor-like uncharacterized protein